MCTWVAELHGVARTRFLVDLGVDVFVLARATAVRTGNPVPLNFTHNLPLMSASKKPAGPGDERVRSYPAGGETITTYLQSSISQL